MKRIITWIAAALGAGVLTAVLALPAAAATTPVSVIVDGTSLYTASPVSPGTVITLDGLSLPGSYTVKSAVPADTPWGHLNKITVNAPLPAAYAYGIAGFTTTAALP